MRIYKFYFSHDRRAPRSLIDMLVRHSDYDVLSWENGELTIASSEGLGKMKKIGQLVAECTASRVFVYHWQVNTFITKGVKYRIDDFEIEEKARAILCL